MSGSLMIVGAGPNMGRHISSYFLGKRKIITVSRSGTSYGDHIIRCEANNLHENTAPIENRSVSTIIYIASSWGETGNVTLSEFTEFSKNGPHGFLATFEAVIRNKLVKNNTLFVSIGSIASESATVAAASTNNPIYSISKLTQKAIVIQLARKYREYRFATITLGSIGDGVSGVGYKNVVSTIAYLDSLKQGIGYSEIALVANSDIAQ